jgi:Histidine phosphatase superfamily (branch 1)
MARLQEAGFRVSAIWSSPFRRCLQTAAAAANALGISEVRVHYGLGETSHAIRRCFTTKGLEALFLASGSAPTYLTLEAMQGVVGDSIAVVPVDTCHYDDDAYGGFAARFFNCVRGIASAPRKADDTTDSLIVTHGDGVGVLGSMLHAPVTVYDVEYCGVLAVDATFTGVVHSHRVAVLSD